MTKPREKTREELTAEIEEGKKKIRQFENREKIIKQTFGLSIPYRIRAGILPPIPRSSRKRAYWRAVRQAALSLTRFLEAAPPDLQRKALTAAISALN